MPQLTHDTTAAGRGEAARGTAPGTADDGGAGAASAAPAAGPAPVVAPVPAAPDRCLDRRQLLARAGAVGLGVAAAGVLAACGAGAPSGPQATHGADGSLGSVGQIPVGGAVSATDAAGKPIILSQPEAGTIVAMTAICTHQGCTVLPAGKDLACPCHGSVYSLTGQNVSGPAPSPLAQIDVHVSNGEVFPGKA